jgi:hypothetical protein
MTIELIIEGIQNPYSSKPAGDVTVITYYEEDMVDQGTSDGSFTPTSGSTNYVSIVVVNAATSGINSSYTLVFKSDSSIPKNGFIHIEMPDRIGLRPSEVLSDGSCTSNTLTCTSVDPVTNVIIIKTQEIILAETSTTIVITGITNPRSIQPTQVIHIVTYDADGISEIDAGYDVGVTMDGLA